MSLVSVFNSLFSDFIPAPPITWGKVQKVENSFFVTDFLSADESATE